MNTSRYPIGTPNQPWTAQDREQWLRSTSMKRRYQEEVVSKITALSSEFDIEQHGSIVADEERFPLYHLKSKKWYSDRPTVLITGGVHGYETSGVHGALQFLAEKAHSYEGHFNIVVVPCVSPWGYQTINRWNADAIDPNRSCYENSPAQESAQLLKLVATLGDILVHFDLHETTDTDESEFRPALAARNGEDYVPGSIPDGFYTVGDTENPQPDFQAAVIQAVARVTHIAPADEQGQIIGSDVVQPGVILYPMKTLGLCGGMTHCRFGTTTEVYPDSEKVTDTECNRAQVAAICGGLDYVITQL